MLKHHWIDEAHELHDKRVMLKVQVSHSGLGCFLRSRDQLLISALVYGFYRLIQHCLEFIYTVIYDHMKSLCILFYSWLLVIFYGFILNTVLQKIMIPHLKKGSFQSSYSPHFPFPQPVLRPPGESISGRRKTGRVEWRLGPDLMRQEV